MQTTRRTHACLGKQLDAMIDKPLLALDRELSYELLIEADPALIGRISDLTISISEVIQNALIEDHQMKQNNKLVKTKESNNKELHLSVVSASLYVSCAKCKKLEDTFEAGEIPNDYLWFYHRKKWYCNACYKDL